MSDDEGRTRDELRARDAELRAIFRAFPDLLFEVAEDGTILSYRAGRTEDLYVSPEQFLGKRMSDVLPPDAGRVLTEALERVVRGQRIACVDYELVVHGATKHFEARVVGLEGKRFIMVVRDVTERWREHEERRELDRKMQEAQRLESLGLLAGGVAHDFNNLLAAILGGVELLSRRLPDQLALSEPLDVIRQASWRASELSRQLLAYAGKGCVEMRHVSIGELVLDTAQLLDTAISKRVHLELDLPDDVPAVHADVAQLRQIIVNLVTNAAEAMGDRDGRITVRMRAADGRVALEVEDDGCGMDGATRQKMFDPFYSTKGSGRGLGLASVLGMVRAHGGHIEVESAPGRGTRIRIELPASTEPAEPLERARTRSSPPLDGGVVLVVDDEPGVRTVMARILEEAGLEVLEAADGHSAIELFERHGGVDVVVLDVTMPGMMGDEVFHALRRIDPVVPVVLTSGYDASDASWRAAVPHPPLFLPKPHRTSALLSAIHRARSRRTKSSQVLARAPRSPRSA